MARIPMLQPRVPTLDTRRVKPPPKAADAELLTAEHREWRRQIIARARGLCQGPQHRGDRSGHRLIADHIAERRDGGALYDVANGQALCWSCHGSKTNAARARRHGAVQR